MPYPALLKSLAKKSPILGRIVRERDDLRSERDNLRRELEAATSERNVPTTGVMPPIKRGQSPWADVRALLGRDPELVFDVGANVGNSAAQIRSWFPHAHVMSFEPVAATFHELLKNTQNWQHFACFNLGFSEQHCKKSVFLQKSSGWNSIEHNIDWGYGHEEITLTTIDCFCDEKDIEVIDLLKTDTEGHDLHVLRGASARLKDGKINAIFTECGFYRDDSQHTNFCDMLQFLQKYRYQFYGIYNTDPALRYIPHNTRPDYPYPDVLFVRDKLVVDKFGANYEDWLHQVGWPLMQIKTTDC